MGLAHTTESVMERNGKKKINFSKLEKIVSNIQEKFRQEKFGLKGSKCRDCLPGWQSSVEVQLVLHHHCPRYCR